MLRKKEKVHKLNVSEGLNLAFLLFILTISGAFAQNFNSTIDKIEENIFHHKYTKEKQEERLSRIENFIFRKDFSDKTLKERIDKITSALNIEKEALQQPEIKLEPESDTLTITPEPDETVHNEPKEEEEFGVIDTISNIEKQLYGKSFNEKPFQDRVEALEEELLSSFERFKAQRRPLLDRVNNLIQKAGINIYSSYPQETIQDTLQQFDAPSIHPPSSQYPQTNNFQGSFSNQPTFTLDPNTGYLINSQTGEIARDSFGNPITIGRQGVNPLQQQFNPFGLPYGNPYYGSTTGSPQMLPPEFFLNPGNGIDLDGGL